MALTAELLCYKKYHQASTVNIDKSIRRHTDLVSIGIAPHPKRSIVIDYERKTRSKVETEIVRYGFKHACCTRAGSKRRFYYR